MQTTEELRERHAPIELTPDEFRSLGHFLIDQVADFLGSISERPVTPGESPRVLQELLDNGSLPSKGTEPKALLKEAADLLFNHSLFNGHPRFWGYITSSAAPIGAFGDLLAAAVNPNVGAWTLSPIASEVEAQTVRWIAELVGYNPDCGGLFVSGGNMANFVCFLTARANRARWNIQESGLRAKDAQQLMVYASPETHIWIQKAADLFGLGMSSIRYVPTDEHLRIDTSKLRQLIKDDMENGNSPFLVVGNAGTVATGAIDPLKEMVSVCRENGLWFHVDGGYGAFAAALPDAPDELEAIRDADSIAVDPHKWLYAPLEAGCVLVRDREKLRKTFSHHPSYYRFEEGSESGLNYYEYGPQNSRGFRALKVWLGLRQVGRDGYVQMISDDIKLSKALYQSVMSQPELQASSQGLSITTFRFVPRNLDPSHNNDEYLNRLNSEVLSEIQRSGKAYLSNAVIDGKFVLRACIVNFRTSMRDIEALPDLVVRTGRDVDSRLRPRNSS